MDVSVLSVTSRAVLAAVERRGIEGAALLAEADLRRDALEDPDLRISAAASDRLWQAAYRHVPEPALALEVALDMPGGTYRIFHYLSANSTTVGDALTRVAACFAVIDPRAELTVAERDGMVVEMRIPSLGTVPRPPAEFTLAALMVQTRHSTGVDFPVVGADFGFPAPADASVHRAAFGAVRYDQPVTALRLHPASWRRPIPRADPVLGAMLAAHARQVTEAVPRVSPLRSQLAAHIAQRLRPLPTQAECARALGMSGRTLQRRLVAEDTSFSAELNHVRERLARTWLPDRALSLSEIAWMLGFSDPSAFSRAFRRWTGAPPSHFRRLSAADKHLSDGVKSIDE